MSLRLGIDTGGTFTDAVLVDDQRNIINAEKSLTTRFDLSLGIGDVIGKLPQASLVDISMVSLSTTLTTNSVVEDLGAPVCVLLPGYNQEQVKQSGLLDILPAQMVVILEGGYDAVGRETPAIGRGARARRHREIAGRSLGFCHFQHVRYAQQQPREPPQANGHRIDRHAGDLRP